MNYDYFNLPKQFDISISEYDTKTAKAFYKWFISIKNERISLLEHFVQLSSGYEKWTASFIPESLDLLHEWFNPMITQRTITDEEQNIIVDSFKANRFYADIKESPKAIWTLSAETECLCVDIGIYFAEIFVRNNKPLFWSQNFSKTSINKNYPVVKGFVGDEINPFKDIRNTVKSQLGGKNSKWSEIYYKELEYIKK